MERKLWKSVGLTLILGVGTLACGTGEGYEVVACDKLDHRVEATFGSGTSEDPKVLISYNDSLADGNKFNDSGNGGAIDYLDKLGEVMCYDPKDTDTFYLTNDGWKLRQNYIARNPSTEQGN